MPLSIFGRHDEWQALDLTNRLKDVIRYSADKLDKDPYPDRDEQVLKLNAREDNKKILPYQQKIEITLCRDLFALIPVFKKIPYEASMAVKEQLIQKSCW